MATAEGNLETDDQDSDDQPSEPPKRSTSTRPKKRARVEEEETPVISGRFLIAAGFVAAATVIPNTTIGQYLEPREPEATHVDSFAVGAESIVRITLVTADYGLLGCASEQAFDGVHCANKTQTEPWPRDPNSVNEDFNNKLDIVQPYRTWYDNKLVFVAGLWSTPDVAYRLHEEPSAGQLPDKLARFAVECKLKFVGRFDNVKLRWNPQQAWVDPDGPAWVGRAETCKLIDEPQ